MNPRVIDGLYFTHLTWVVNGEEGDEDRVHSPVNKAARLVHVSKARVARRQPQTILGYVQKCAGPRTGREVAQKAIVVAAGDTVLVALKANTVNTARREVVGILSTTDVDSQNEAIDAEALRVATLDLAARVGSKAFTVDKTTIRRACSMNRRSHSKPFGRAPAESATTARSTVCGIFPMARSSGKR